VDQPDLVDIRLNKAGGNLLYTLTSTNLPTGSQENRKHRHLAIILDGQILSVPRLNAAIRDAAQIDGNFTKEEVDRMVRILRAGVLPATLKPVPVSEKVMEKK
jgi:SecD/SecF fusion protein